MLGKVQLALSDADFGLQALVEQAEEAALLLTMLHQPDGCSVVH